jgi:arylsulfatase A-like enzyme
MPNILVVMLDGVRPDFLSVNGGPCKTPVLDALASQGILFENAYSEFPVSIPTRTALVTGNYTFTNRPWTPLKPYDTHIAEILRDHGYETAAISDSPFQPVFNMDRGFDEFQSLPVKIDAPDPVGSHWDEELLNAAAFPDDLECERERRIWTNFVKGFCSEWPRKFGSVGIELMAERVVQWLHQRKRKRRPFFLWVDSFQPHEPFWPPESFRKMYQNADYRGRIIPMPPEASVNRMTPEELEHCRGLYMAEISYTDAFLAPILEAVEQTGLTEDTLVIVLSDHGLPFGEHGTIRKFGVPVYDELAKVVWIMRLPGLTQPGARIKALVQTTDFLPTILDLLRIPAPARNEWRDHNNIEAPQSIDGVSLLPLLKNKAAEVRESIYTGAFGERSSVRQGQWKFIDNRGEKPNELFDLTADPGERHNLADAESERATRLHRSLWRFQRRWGTMLLPPDVCGAVRQERDTLFAQTDTLLAEKNAALADKDHHIANIEAARAETDAELRDIRMQYQVTTSTVGYRLLERIRRVINRLAPEGTRRRRLFAAASRRADKTAQLFRTRR